jgi:hypothetical protein
MAAESAECPQLFAKIPGSRTLPRVLDCSCRHLPCLRSRELRNADGSSGVVYHHTNQLGPDVHRPPTRGLGMTAGMLTMLACNFFEVHQLLVAFVPQPSSKQPSNLHRSQHRLHTMHCLRRPSG